MISAMTAAGARPREESVPGGPVPDRLVPGQAVRHEPDVPELLMDAARLARQALGADHASVLLRDSAGRLVPAASVAPTDDLLASSRFRARPPIRCDAIPNGVSGVPENRPIVVNDANSSELVPADWRAAVGVKSAAITPIVVDGVLRGALIVDYCDVPHEFSDNELRLLEAAAGPLRYLLGIVDVSEDAQRRQELVDRVMVAGRELCAARTRHAVLQAGMDAVLDVVGGTACCVHAVTPDGVDTLASRGPRQPDPGPRPEAELDEVTRAALRAAEAGPARPVLLGGGAHLVIPMTEADGIEQAILVVTSPSAMTIADLDVAAALAAQTWLAHQRAAEAAWLTGRIEFLDVLCAVAGDPAPRSDMQRLLGRLAPAVRAATGIEIVDAFLTDCVAARAFSTPTADRRLAGLLRRWKRATTAQPEVMDDLLVLPIRSNGTVIGALRARPGREVGGEVGRLLDDAARAIGDAVGRTLLRLRAAEVERELAVAAERERVGTDLHEALAQQLFALRVELDALAGTVSDRTVAAQLRDAVTVVTRANADLRLAVHAQSFLEQAKRGLVPSLRTLVRKLAATTPISLQVKVVGTPEPIDDGSEQALFRVAHEALANVVSHSRASTATLTVSYSPERVSIIVRDDGTGMSARSDEQRGLHAGLRAMQRRMAELGGGLEVSNFRPHGVCLHAWVPVR